MSADKEAYAHITMQLGEVWDDIIEINRKLQSCISNNDDYTILAKEYIIKQERYKTLVDLERYLFRRCIKNDSNKN